MMANPLVSSPICGRRLQPTTFSVGPSGPTASRPGLLDIFDQPSSPRIEHHDDLPAEFGDQSFGSSMSLGSSFEVARRASAASACSAEAGNATQAPSAPKTAPYVADTPRSSPSSAGIFGTTIRRANQGSPSRSSQDGLGAAMGTVLHSRTPGLAAKLSSPQPMDMSPAPARQIVPCPLSATPSKAYRNRCQGSSGNVSASSSSERLPPGSAMKEDTPPEHTLRIRSVTRRATADDTSAVDQLQSGSLMRLFGTELSLNQKESNGSRKSLDCFFGATGSPHSLCGDDSIETVSSPDKEPPAKRRPASLPLSHSNFAGRVQGSAVFASSTANAQAGLARNRRPSLLKSMTDGTAQEETSRERKSSFDAIRTLHRSSDPSLPTIQGFMLGRPSRSRPGSAERTSEPGSRERMLKSSLPPTSHETIIESPSPSKLADDQFAEYFLDPQSPEALRAQSIARRQSKQTSAAPQQSLLGVASSSARSIAPPRPRPLEKAASSAVLPTMLGSSLGKRSNPYAKRPALLQQNSGVSIKSALAAPGISSRLRPSIPRRCHSAMDNTAAFALGEDMSMSSAEDGDFPADDESPSFKNKGVSFLTRPHVPAAFNVGGSPIGGNGHGQISRPGLFRKSSKDDSSPLGYGKRFTVAAVPDGSDASTKELSPRMRRTSIDNNMPGFGASEREGKILPCFSVKKDGLMRISPETMRSVLDGRFDNEIDDYTVVDCRFAYEFQGGHIQGAINLCTLEKVKKHFLQPDDSSLLPLRSQSGKRDAAGRLKKKVVIFHCEFSQKRGPSSALALRQADRSLAADYPNCHYPELYVLDGGYAEFFKGNATACQPPCYVQMDDPQFQEIRSREINDFRKQFSRHRSFTFGDNALHVNRATHSDGTHATLTSRDLSAGLYPMKGTSSSRGTERAVIQEEESSFDTSISPSAVQASAAVNRRRGLQRHATAGHLPLAGGLGGGSNHFLGENWIASSRTQSPKSSNARMLPPSRLPTKTKEELPSPSSSLGRRPILGSNGELAADLSFGSSTGEVSPCARQGGNGGVPTLNTQIGNESSSFDTSGLCESPCAVAQTRGGVPARPAVWR